MGGVCFVFPSVALPHTRGSLCRSCVLLLPAVLYWRTEIASSNLQGQLSGLRLAPIVPPPQPRPIVASLLDSSQDYNRSQGHVVTLLDENVAPSRSSSSASTPTL